MKLLLHIGTGKTGSTSIQKSLKLNWENLLSQRVLFPVSFQHGKHVFLPMLVAEPDRFQGLFARFFPPDRRHLLEAERREWVSKLSDLVASTSAQADLCVLSAEHLSGLNTPEIERLKQLVFPIFSSVQVVVYLRDPADYAVSMYDTAMKVGGQSPHPLPPSKYPELDFASLIQRWQTAVGEDAVQVRLFEKSFLKDGDILQDFCSLIGVNRSGFEELPKQNESMDLLGQALLYRINKMLPHLTPKGEVNHDRAEIARVVAKRFSYGPRVSASPELAAEYDNAFAESNEWVRASYFPDRKRLFEVKERNEARPLNIPDIYLDEMAHALVELWRVKRSD